MMTAKFTGVAEIEIEKDEAKLLAAATAEVASHYNMVVDPKIVAWVGLVGVCGSIYGPRFAAYKLRKRFERKNDDGETFAQNEVNSFSGHTVNLQ